MLEPVCLVWGCWKYYWRHSQIDEYAWNVSFNSRRNIFLDSTHLPAYLVKNVCFPCFAFTIQPQVQFYSRIIIMCDNFFMQVSIYSTSSCIIDECVRWQLRVYVVYSWLIQFTSPLWATLIINPNLCQYQISVKKKKPCKRKMILSNPTVGSYLASGNTWFDLPNEGY